MNHEVYLKRKSEGKIKGIAELSARKKNIQQQKWRANIKRYIDKKIQQVITVSDLEQEEIQFNPSVSDSSRSRISSGRKKVRRERSAFYRQLTKLSAELERSKRSAEMKKKLQNKTKYMPVYHRPEQRYEKSLHEKTNK